MTPLPSESLPEAGHLGSGPFGRFRVKDWAAVGLGLETQEQWRAWACGMDHEPAASSQPSAAVPSLLRRRVTPIGQQALRAAYRLAGPGTRYVFCSRHGEFKRTLVLLETIARRDPTSPAEFSLSVHNALPGLLSIATQNHAGHTAVAGGPDSFGLGFLEALGCLFERPDETVLLVYFDESLPAPYIELPETEGPGIVLALLLAAAGCTAGDLVVSAEPVANVSHTRQTDRHALDFIRFFLSNQDEHVHHGARMVWRWARAG